METPRFNAYYTEQLRETIALLPVPSFEVIISNEIGTSLTLD